MTMETVYKLHIHTYVAHTKSPSVQSLLIVPTCSYDTRDYCIYVDPCKTRQQLNNSTTKDKTHWKNNKTNQLTKTLPICNVFLQYCMHP